VTYVEGHVSEVAFPGLRIRNIISNRLVEAHTHAKAEVTEQKLWK
jgi:hypothetical protein